MFYLTLQLLFLLFLLVFIIGLIVGIAVKYFLCQTVSNNMMQSLKKNDFFLYGEIIPNLILNGQLATYQVVNEKAVRKQAGITAFLAALALSFTQLAQNWLLIKIVATLFFIDFFAKVIIGIKFSFFYQISKFLVKNKEPEYVGAVQKRFAWSIGLVLSTFMLYLQYIAEAKGIVPMSLCVMCLVFMSLEWLFGLCVGCRLYYGLISLGLIRKPDIAPACPGGVCPIPKANRMPLYDLTSGH